MRKQFILIAAAMIAATSITVLSTATAHAQTDDAKAKAKQHFADGTKLVDAGKFSEAYEEFSQGYELSKKPLFLMNMGECARQANDNDNARKAYNGYLAAEPNGKMASLAKERLAALPAAEPEAKPAPAPVAPAPVDVRPKSTDLAAATEGQPPLDNQRDDDGGSIFGKWPFWAAVGAVVVAGGVTAIILSQSGGGSDGSHCSGDCQAIDFSRGH